MIDQAQGLRALVSKARRGHAGISLLDDNDSDNLSQEHTPYPSQDAPEQDSSSGQASHEDVLNPEAARLVTSSHDTAPDSLAMETDAALVSSTAPISAERNPAQHINGRAGTGVGRDHAAPVYAAVSQPRSAHRDAARSSNPAEVQTPVTQARVVAVTSGKGGVGKTNFCTNLALTLAARGQRVIIVDADLGLANVHVVLGVAPRFHLEHVMRGEKTLQEVLYTGPSGVGIIGGGSGLADMANLDEARRSRFIAGLSELDSMADVILLDTGAGLSHNVLAFLCAVEEVIVITTPEPTAITDAYATIKVLSQENPGAQQRLVVNMAQSEAEAQAVAQRLQSITRRFLGRDLDWLGYLPHDMTVSRAVRAQQPFSLLAPDAPVTRAIVRLAARLGYDQPRPVTQAAGVSGLLTRMQRFFQHRS